MKTNAWLKLILLAVVCFTLAVILQPRAMNWSERARSDNVLNVLFGDGRRLFANHFFVQADVSFHSGYYPSIFDQANKPDQSQSPMVTGNEDHHDHDAHGDHGHDHNEAESLHEEGMDYLGKPRDWIEAFGRHFIVTEHTHLKGGQEREILPWLRISASLDPQRVDTYTVAAFWLREMGKVKEAEQFLREGLRANPNNPEILFDLGCLYNENLHDSVRARDVWELALRRWRQTEAKKDVPDNELLDKIAVNLGRLEEKAGNFDEAIYYLELGKAVSPEPEALERQILEIKQKKSAVPQSALNSTNQTVHL